MKKKYISYIYIYFLYFLLLFSPLEGSLPQKKSNNIIGCTASHLLKDIAAFFYLCPETEAAFKIFKLLKSKCDLKIKDINGSLEVCIQFLKLI